MEAKWQYVHQLDIIHASIMSNAIAACMLACSQLCAAVIASMQLTS